MPQRWTTQEQAAVWQLVKAIQTHNKAVLYQLMAEWLEVLRSNESAGYVACETSHQLYKESVLWFIRTNTPDIDAQQVVKELEQQSLISAAQILIQNNCKLGADFSCDGDKMYLSRLAWQVLAKYQLENPHLYCRAPQSLKNPYRLLHKQLRVPFFSNLLAISRRRVQSGEMTNHQIAAYFIYLLKGLIKRNPWLERSFPLLLLSAAVDGFSADRIQLIAHIANFDQPVCRIDECIDDITLALEARIVDICGISFYYTEDLKKLGLVWFQPDEIADLLDSMEH